MASAIDICNSALTKLGSERIDSLSEESKQARLCNQQYPIIRDELLASHFWNFAMKRAQLASVTVTEPISTRFPFAFQIPSDSLRIVYLEDQNVDFKVEGNLIFADIESPSLLYISKETDVARFSATFREALAYRLAEDIAYPLIQSVSVMDRMKARADQRLADARSFDGQEGVIDPLESDVFLDSRIVRGGTEGPRGRGRFF